MKEYDDCVKILNLNNTYLNELNRMIIDSENKWECGSDLDLDLDSLKDSTIHFRGYFMVMIIVMVMIMSISTSMSSMR